MPDGLSAWGACAGMLVKMIARHRENCMNASATPMGASPTARLDTSPLSEALGIAVHGIDLSRPIEREVALAIRALLYEHCVLLVPGQHLDEATQIRFGEYFGELGHTLGDYGLNNRTHPAVMYVTNEKENGQYVGALPDGEMFFHSDRCYMPQPTLATMLYAIDIPSRGGNTIFANQYTAWDTLPDAIRQRIEGREAMNTYDPGIHADNTAPVSQTAPSAKALRAAHPLVKAHPATGRKAIYANRLMTEYIVGMPRSESDDLLAALFAHQERPELCYEHRWTLGDTLIWDNRCVLHARTNFDPGEARKLRRVVVNVERAL